MPIYLHHFGNDCTLHKLCQAQNLVEHCTDRSFGKMFGKAASASRSTETSTPSTAVKPGTRMMGWWCKPPFQHELLLQNLVLRIPVVGRVLANFHIWATHLLASCWWSPIVELTLPLPESTPVSDHWSLTNHVGRQSLIYFPHTGFGRFGCPSVCSTFWTRGKMPLFMPEVILSKVCNCVPILVKANQSQTLNKHPKSRETVKTKISSAWYYISRITES